MELPPTDFEPAAIFPPIFSCRLPDRDRTEDLFHVIAKYRRHSTYEPAQPAETAQWALFAGKMRAKLKPSGQRADRVESAQHFSMIHS
jgi:hypothetical protein